MSGQNIDISIVIVNYKTPTLTDICVGSIYKYTKELTFEIIVVDNDSQDESENLITNKYPEVVWINSGLNAGTSIAYNIGIRAAKGRYILILNSDTEFRDNILLTSLTEYRELESKYEKVGLYSCQLIGYDNIVQYNSNISFPSIKKFLRSNSVNIRLGIFQQKATEAERHQQHLASHETKWIGIAFGLLNANICKKDGHYFDEDIFMYSDEVEWCHRLIKNGYRHFFSSSGTIIHLNGGSSVFSEWRHGQIVLSEWLYFMKVKGKGYFMLCVFQILLNHLIDSLFYSKQKILGRLSELDSEAKKIRDLEFSIIKKYFGKILCDYGRNPSSGKSFLKYEMLRKQ